MASQSQIRILPVARAVSELLFHTSIEYRQAIIELVAQLFPPEEQDRWMLTPHPALKGEWSALAMQKGNEEAVYRLLIRLIKGH